MSLEFLTSQIAKNRAEAAGIQEQWSRAVKDVGHDRNLTDDGKRASLDDLYQKLKPELKVLLGKEKQMVQTKQESLERALFGLASPDANKIIIYRDAQDRVAQAVKESPAAVRALYNSAMISNDDSLAKAVLAYVVKNGGFRDILDDWSQRNPVWREELNDLVGIQHYNSDGNTGMQRSLAYSIIRGPSAGDPNGGAQARFADWLKS